MLSDALSEGLGNYRIGQKVRSLRSAKSLGLAQLGDHTGLSAGMLSKIERGQVIPTLPTLMRIALVFGVGLDHFFIDEAEPVLEVVRSKNRLKLPDTKEKMPTYFFESLDYPANDRPIDSFLSEFMPGKPASEPHEHNGVELIYVITGVIDVQIHDETHRLETKDSMYFDARFPHSYKCVSDDQATAVVIAAKECE